MVDLGPKVWGSGSQSSSPKGGDSESLLNHTFALV